MDIIMSSQAFFQNTFILSRPRVAIFADIMKIATMFTETIFRLKNFKLWRCIL